MDRLNIYNYEILIKQKQEHYLAFCPQLNIVVEDINEEKTYNKMKNLIKKQVSDLRLKDKTDKKETDLIKKRAIHDVEDELKSNLVDSENNTKNRFINPTEKLQKKEINDNETEINISEFDGLLTNEETMI